MRFPRQHPALLATLTATVVIAAFAGAAATHAAALVARSTAIAAAAARPTCGGVKLAKPGGGLYVCTFDDEFNASTLDTSKWTAQLTSASGFHSGPECFKNRPTNVSVSAGVLKLTARKATARFTCASPLGSYTTQYTSGSVSTYAKFSQAYGRFEVRAKVSASAVKGLQESFWLWPANAVKYGPTWPASGEIDIAEIYSLHADRAIPFIHYNAAGYDPHVTNNYCLISNIAAFHKYAVEWTPATIRVGYDGHTCLLDNWNPAGMVKPAPFDQPFMVALTQALGIGTNAFSATTTKLPATTQVDYVRVYK
jgi:beta-glucanase (GH16 family)